MAHIMKGIGMEYKIAALNAAHILSEKCFLTRRGAKAFLDVLDNASINAYGNNSEEYFRMALGTIDRMIYGAHAEYNAKS